MREIGHRHSEPYFLQKRGEITQMRGDLAEVAVSGVMRWKFFHNLLKNQGILQDSQKVLDHSSEYYMASEHLNTAVS
jgi:hypothetical protein